MATNGDIWRVVANMSYEGNDVQNTYYCRLNGNVSDPDADILDLIADHLDTAYGEIVTAMDIRLHFDSITAYSVTQSLYIGAVSWPVLTTGTSNTGMLPPGVAALVLFPTGVLNSQGRKFFALYGLGRTDTNGTPSTTALTELAAYAADIVAGFTYGTWECEFGAYNIPLTAFREYISALIPDKFATQTRRYRGRGS